jgi:hypothetical protein
MVKRLCLLTILLFITTVDLRAQGGLNSACVADCDRRTQACTDYSVGVYVTCGQQGGSDEECQKKRTQAYQDCYSKTGCALCFACGDWRMGLLGRAYYCNCGNPYYCGGDSSTDCGLTFDGGYSNPCDCNPDDPACTSPVIVDVVGNGFDLTSVPNGVRFDLRANGKPIKTAWTAAYSDDAWLALDRNGNCVIDNGSELFGNFTPQSAQQKKNGFAALADLDSNFDGVITGADPVYADLRLWQDTNHNGVSETSELHSLADKSVYSIEVAPKESRHRDAHGNVFRYRGKVNGTKWAYDVFLIHEN